MTQRSATAKRSHPRFKLISETIAELKKVVWLTRREVAYLTILVIIISLVAALVLGIIDFGFTRLVNDLFLGK